MSAILMDREMGTPRLYNVKDFSEGLMWLVGFANLHKHLLNQYCFYLTKIFLHYF